MARTHFIDIFSFNTRKNRKILFYLSITLIILTILYQKQKRPDIEAEMKTTPEKNNSDELQISQQIGHRAGNLFLTQQLWCSGAVLVALNHALRGDLTQDQAIRLTAGLGDGMGGAGCLCGGLNGGALALGLFLGNGRLSPGGDQKVLEATRELHDQFKQAHGSTCCRVLMKKDVESYKKQFRSCARRTADAAELCAMLIFRKRPELIRQVDYDYLQHKDGALKARMKIIADKLAAGK